jgi:MYXO-CTERM domain-containing protein
MINRIKLVLLGAVSAALLSSAAGAQVFQTDTAMTPLPQPVAKTELDLITTSWGWNVATTSWKDPYTGLQLMTPPPTFTDPKSGAALPIPIPFGQFYSPANGHPQFENGDAITLKGLFKWRRETLDPVKDAKTEPGYFSPACGFSGQLLLMGGNCNVSFGWYNVADPNSTTPPPANEIYEFIPNDPKYLNCLDENGDPKIDGFCPKAWDTRSPRNLAVHTWTPKAFDSGNIKIDARYKGGYVGFAVIGNPAKACKQNKYSMAAYNQKNASGKPWVTTLIYQSTVDPEGFYMAFEDLPMSPADWHKTGVPGDMAENDGDFNDFVFYISGISCMGGGQACTTPLQGACSLGRTDCAVGSEAPACRPIIQPGKELCDNVDNDCNGMVDDGPGLCLAGQVCDKGVCVAACSTGEFNCRIGTVCNAAGFCVDEACATVSCPAGQACRAGNCINACDGTTCPPGQECQLGRCVNPCAGITCPAGRVCERGLCVTDCACRGCSAGLVCGGDGRCADTMCANVTCPTGQVCEAGVCKDPCAGVVCPGGATCVNGVCGDPGMSGGATGNGTAGGFTIGHTGGSTGNGTGSTTSTGSTGNGTGGGRERPSASSGCNCRAAEGEDSALAWFGAAAGAALLFGRRRRR